MLPSALVLAITLGVSAPYAQMCFKSIPADYSHVYFPPLFKISLLDYTVDFKAKIRSDHFVDIKVVKSPPQIAAWVENTIKTISVDQPDSDQPKSFRIKLRGSSTPKLFEKVPH